MTGKPSERSVAVTLSRTGIACIVCALLSGCTVLDSGDSGVPLADRTDAAARRLALGNYALPRKYLRIEVSGETESYATATSLSVDRDATKDEVLPDPDTRVRYNLNYAPSGMSDDVIKVDFQNQLLTSVNVSTTDRTGAILVSLAEALGRIGRLAAGLSTPGAGGNVLLTLSLDPTDPESVASTRRALGEKMELRLRPEPRPMGDVPRCGFSICYRPLTSVTLSFREAATGNVTEFLVQVPDPHTIVGIDLERSAFVKRDTVLTFSSGTLTKVDLNKPSEVAAAAMLPIAVVDAVFKGVNAAVGDLVGVRKNEAEKSTELLKAQAEYLKAYSSYLDQVDAFEKARSGGKIDPGQKSGTSPILGGTPSAQASQPSCDDGQEACEEGSPSLGQ